MIFDVSLPFTLSSLKLPPFSFWWRKIWQQGVCVSLSLATPNVSFISKKWPLYFISIFPFMDHHPVLLPREPKKKMKSQIVFLQDEKRSSDRNSVYSKDASGAGGNQHIESSLPSSPAPPPRPLSSISTGRIGYKAVAASFFYFSFAKKPHTNWTDIGPEFDLL